MLFALKQTAPLHAFYRAYGLLFVILAFFTYGTLSAQTQEANYRVYGSIKDVESQKALSGVSVWIEGSSRGTSSDSLGGFALSGLKGEQSLRISSIGYVSQKIWVNASTKYPLHIQLRPEVTVLDPLNINANQVDTLIQDERRSVLAFEWHKGHLYLLSFGLNTKHAQLLVLSENLDTLAEIDCPLNAQSLVKDCFGTMHILGKNKSCQLDYSEPNGLRLYPLTPIDTFQKELKPCVCINQDFMYLAKKDGSETLDMEFFRIKTNNHALRYTFHHLQTKEKGILKEIVDEKTRERKKNEARFASNGSYHSGFSQEIDRVFAETIVFSEIEAPLFNVNDTLHLFDFINDRLLRFKQNAVELSLNIDFHKETGFTKQLSIDEQKNKVYALFQQNASITLKAIDLKTGKAMEGISIPYPFPENIQVYNGYIYFLYKAFGPFETKFLARVRAK